uniref:Uncharacterized protein n=1 Tax=Aegilops tauschii subsp. strangulata TaxID=200361 RepID=A0A453FDD4_AEGTS
EKLMPPPPATITRGSNLRSSSSFPPRVAGGDANNQPPHHSRSVEERSGGVHKRSSPDKAPHHKPPAAEHHMDSKNAHHHHHHHHSNNHDSQLVSAANGTGTGAGEKLGGERLELPRIYISLSRKEKEDDFLVMKGTKLPQRPKKRAKNVDKSLQVCIHLSHHAPVKTESDRIHLTCVLLQFVFPGMWLSDLTKGRYEVREKKCVKKRRRGLKGMESMDSDSE